MVTGSTGRDALLADLAAILERIARLEEYDGPLLMARYQQELGGLELRLLLLQVECRAMVRRIELAQQLLNRGREVTPARVREINDTVEGELQVWRGQVETQEKVLRHNLLLMQGMATAPLVDMGRLKALYRQLVRCLHPDAAPDHADLHDQYWTAVQNAYQQGEVEVLEAILHVVKGELAALRTADANPHPADPEPEALRALLHHHAARLAALQKTAPYCYAALLNDANWVAAKKAELEGAVAQVAQRLEHLTAQFAAIQWPELMDHEQPPAAVGDPPPVDGQDPGQRTPGPALCPGDLSP